MKKINVLLIALTLIAVSCKNEKKELKTTENKAPEVIKEIIETNTITVALNAKSGSNVSGEIVFKEENGTVNMTAKISGLNAGEHAIHIHATSDCSSDNGKSAGGHWNPTSQPHGKWGDKKGYHKGDIGNFTADENGNALITFSTNEWCIGCEDETKNILDKGVIVHAGIDDYTSQPSGAAGARVSCAGIIR